MHRGFLTLLGAATLLACGDDAGGTGSTGDESNTSTMGSTTEEASTGTPDGTTAASSTGADSTGAEAVCGNGQVEPGEDCDDANLVEDDGCYSSCTLPYEELWTQTYDDGGEDIARAARFDAEGNLYVLGVTETDGGNDDVWLRQYLPDGSEGWTWTHDGLIGGDDLGRALEWHPSGDLMIVGSETSDQGSDVLVIRLDPSDQSVVWSDTFDGPDMGPMGEDDDTGAAVAVDADGSVLVAGTVRVPGQEADMWLRRYDADGSEVWTITHDEALLFDYAESVVVDADGNIYLAGAVDRAQNVRDAWIRKLDPEGNEIWTNLIAPAFVSGLALDPEGNLVVAGIDVEADTVPVIWIAKYDPDFVEIASLVTNGVGSGDFAFGVAVGGGGDVYVGGRVNVFGQQGQAWAGRFLPNLGLQWWSHQYGNDRAQLDDAVTGIAVSDDEGRVALVGFESVLGQGRDIWVRVLQNNPVPLQ